MTMEFNKPHRSLSELESALSELESAHNELVWSITDGERYQTTQNTRRTAHIVRARLFEVESAFARLFEDEPLVSLRYLEALGPMVRIDASRILRIADAWLLLKATVLARADAMKEKADGGGKR